MAYVRFNNEGYDYYKNNKILFSTDNTHIYLFDYVAKNLSCLPELFKQYVSLRMNTTTFELRKRTNNADDFNAIKKTLISVHPYYEHEYEKVVLNAIGDYFNELLVYSVYEKKSLEPDSALSKDWYYLRLQNLIPAPIVIGKNFPVGLSLSDFYSKYQYLIDYNFTCENNLAKTFIQVPGKMPVGFTKELQVHKRISHLLYFILDSSVKYMEDLSIFQRAWLYGNIFPERNLESGIPRKILFHPPTLYSEKDCREEDGHYWNEAIECNNKMRDKFHLFYATKPIYAKGNIPKHLRGIFSSAVEYAKKNKNANKFYEIYEINELNELLYLETTSMIQSEVNIKKCENCGKYFIQNDHKKKYCGTTCAKEAKRKLNQQRYEKNPALILYHNAYNKNKARDKNGTISPNEFETWRKNAKEKCDQVTSGEMDINIFEEWLKEYDLPNKIKKLK